MKCRMIRRAYTLSELLITVTVVSLVSMVVVPVAIRGSSTPALKAAANVLAADIEFAQSESISHPNAPRLVQFDLNNNRYWLATQAAPTTPLTHPGDGQPYLNDFQSGRTARFEGVAITAAILTSGSSLAFDIYGRPVGQTADPTIRLSNGASSITLTVDRITGEVTMSTP